MYTNTHTYTCGYIYIYIYIYIRGVTVHVFVPNRFGTGLSIRYACVPNEYGRPFFSGNSNNECRFDSLWCGMTDRCINALESRFWDGSETCWYKPNTSIDSSDRDQLRFPRLSRDAPQTCAVMAEWSASERDHSFLCTTSFNVNKHDWTSHASCNCSVSVSTAERHQQNSMEIKCHVAFHLPQQVISVHSSLVH